MFRQLWLSRVQNETNRIGVLLARISRSLLRNKIKRKSKERRLLLFLCFYVFKENLFLSNHDCEEIFFRSFVISRVQQITDSRRKISAKRLVYNSTSSRQQWNEHTLSLSLSFFLSLLYIYAFLYPLHIFFFSYITLHRYDNFFLRYLCCRLIIFV